MASFNEYIQNLSPLDQALIVQLDLITKKESLFAGEYVLRPGRMLSRIYFLEHGLAKAFSFEQNGQLDLQQFFQSGSILWDTDSLLSRRSSQVYIQLLEDSLLSSIDFPDLHTLLQQSSQARKCANLVLADCLQQRDLRSVLLGMPLAKRYAYFCTQFPCQQLAVQDIASYLRVHASSLSRLRGRRS